MSRPSKTIDPSVSQLLVWLDEISDGDLPKFADHVGTMPAEQMQWLIYNWPRLRELSPQKVPTGAIRPLVGGSIRNHAHAANVVSSLLLYVDHAAVSAEMLLPTLRPDRATSSVERVEDNLMAWQREIPNRLRMIHDLRPLIEDGSLIFMPVSHPLALSSEMSALQELWPELDFDLTDDYYMLAEPNDSLEASLANAFRAVLREVATPLDMDDWTRVMNRSLGPERLLDPRSTHAGRLIELTAPRLELPIHDLVALRRDSTSIARLRGSLRESLSDFAAIPSESDGIETARAIVADRLRHDLVFVQHDTHRSRVLSVAAGAGRRLGFVGLGAAAGAAMATALSAPIVGAVTGATSGATVALAESIREDLAARGTRRAGMAIEAVITAFEK